MPKPAPMGYSSELLAVPGVAFDIHIADPIKRIQAYLESYRRCVLPDGSSGFEDALMTDHLEVISATSSREKTAVAFLLKAGPSLANRLGNLHGGAVALVYDMCTTMCTAPLARIDFWRFGGVSRNLSVTYLRPARADTEILVECEVLQIGARLATIRGQMRDKATGSLLSVAEHSKATVTFIDSKV